MHIREFSYILTIVEQKSFTKAANVLYIAQPSLSAYVKNLEHRLGITFFAKTSGQLVLTEEGAIYVKYAREIMDLNNTMMEELERAANKQKLICRVGLTVTRSIDLMPKFLSAMSEKYPGISVEVVVNKTSDLVNSVLNQELDFIMVNKAFENNKLEYINLFHEEMLVAVNKSNPVLQHTEEIPGEKLRMINMKNLINEPVVALQLGHWQRRMLDFLYHKQNAKPKIACETTNPTSAIALVRSGLGFTTVVKSIVDRYALNDDVEFLTIQNPYPQVEYVIASLKDRKMSDTVQNAVKIVCDIFHNGLHTLPAATLLTRE